MHVCGGDYDVWRMRVHELVRGQMYNYADNTHDKLKWNVVTSSGIV